MRGSGAIVRFGRMLDKIRLHARGALPPEYHANLGERRPRCSTPGAAASSGSPTPTCARGRSRGAATRRSSPGPTPAGRRAATRNA